MGVLITTLDTTSYRVFEVQVQTENSGWGCYNWHAFNDSRRPETKKDGYGSVFGNFEERNQDVAHHPSRLQSWGRITRSKPTDPPLPEHTVKGYNSRDSMTFTDMDAALAYAGRLQKFGRWAHGWSSEQDFNLKRRKERLVVRVVQIELVSARAQCGPVLK